MEHSSKAEKVTDVHRIEVVETSKATTKTKVMITKAGVKEIIHQFDVLDVAMRHGPARLQAA